MKSENNSTYKGNLILNIITEKCPHCGQSKVFKKKKKLFQIPEMKEACDVCHYKFDREPGYFIGAMYLSYGMTVLEGIITFLVCYFFFPNMATIWIPILIMCVILLCSTKNFKLARVAYIHIFPW